MSMERHLTGHIKELNTRCGIINREIRVIGAEAQVGKKEFRAE